MGDLTKEVPHMESLVLEIRSAEGGQDAKLLVEDMMAIYIKVGGRRCL